MTEIDPAAQASAYLRVTKALLEAMKQMPGIDLERCEELQDRAREIEAQMARAGISIPDTRCVDCDEELTWDPVRGCYATVNAVPMCYPPGQPLGNMMHTPVEQ